MAVDGSEPPCCESPVTPYEEESDDRSSERSSSPGRGGDSTASTTSSAPPTRVTLHNGTARGEEAEPLSRMDSEDRDSLEVDCAAFGGRGEGAWAMLDNSKLHNLLQPFIVKGIDGFIRDSLEVDCAALEGRGEGAWAMLDNSKLHNLGQPFIVKGNDGLFSISSSTLMDVDSTISSGRSTPSMMNGLGLSTSSSKSISYNCCWDQCQTCFSSSPDLAEHIRSIHVDGQRGGVFVCFWKGCKVYNTPSTSQSWLQRHMLTHSGDKPFKCVVGGCNASFASQGGLARHVPTHFSQQSSSKMSSHKSKEDSPSKAGLNKRRKMKNRRKRTLPRPHDFFDAQTLDAIRHRAICFNISAQIESLGKGNSVVFHSTVIAKRKEESGKVKLLLHWTPEDILPDAWVNETERHQLKTKVVHLSKLPRDTAVLLDPNIYRPLPVMRLKRR